MAKITGKDRFKKRLKNTRRDAAKEVVRVLYVVGQAIEVDAEISITQGSISGKGHIPSLPGQPPNADTRQLDTNIETKIITQLPPVVHVTSNAPYSAALEFGTSKMAERPFMRPAAKKNRPEIPKKTRKAIRKIVRRG